MGFFRFIASIHFWKHLGLSILLTLVLVWLVTKFLDAFTNHGESIIVPSVIGLQIEKVEDFLSANDLEYIVVDSIFDVKKQKGTVLAQDPLPGSKVKHHRKIYLTVVASNPDKVSMPNLIDLTLREALSRLQTYALKVGTLKFVPDIGKNAVLKQLYKNKAIDSGTKIEKGSSIDLVLGRGLEAEKIPVPFLYGKTHDEAVKAINGASLNIGDEIFEHGADSSNGRVYKQSPSYSHGNSINYGASIDLWYKSDKTFDFKAFLKKMIRDTASH